MAGHIDAITGDASRFEAQALEQLVCPQCEAKAKQECVTKGGNPAKAMHVSRWSPLAQAFRAGYDMALPMSPMPAVS